MSAESDLRALLARPRPVIEDGIDWLDKHGDAVLALLDAAQAVGGYSRTGYIDTPSGRAARRRLDDCARALSEPRP